MGFKRSEWNAIIQAVNDKITACESELPLLDEAGINHRWSVADILAVQNTLSELCPNTSFDPFIPLRWKQSTFNYLQEAIENCNCCDQELLASVIALNGTPATIPHTFTSSLTPPNPELSQLVWIYHADGSFEPSLGQFLGFPNIYAGFKGVLYVRLWIVPYDPEYNPPYERILETAVFFLQAFTDCAGHVYAANSDSYSFSIGAISVTVLEERLDITWMTGGSSCCS
jgi:hypothetical protein